ncbi:MAG: MFS transporter [Solirubrobacteraceae bacterium]
MRSTAGGRAGVGAPPLLALAVGLVLADSSVVTLALPAILREFDASVTAVAWVLIAFNLALALAALPGARLVRGHARTAFAGAVVAFAAASLACAAAPSLDLLIAARALQGVIGAVVVAAALELLLLRCSESSRAIALWGAAGVLGGAIGPAAGGLLTEAFSWEAMFALQAPVILIALLGARGLPRAVLPDGHAATAGQHGDRPAMPAIVALALVSAALAAALFLLVVMLIEGWRLSPGEAALVVTARPLAALLAGRWARDARRLEPALPGCVLLAGGLAALGLLPDAGAEWTIAPQLAIGAGLGLALGALIGVTVGAGGGVEPSRPAAWTIAARHAGIVAGLLILTPIFTSDLAGAREPAERAGLAEVLDAPIALQPKIALARALDAELDDISDQRLPDLDGAFAVVDLPANDRAATDALRDELDDELDGAATSAFSRSFLAAALLALLAAGAVGIALARSRTSTPVSGASNGNRLAPAPSLSVALPGSVVIATLLACGYLALGGSSYGPSAVADPCAQRARPDVERTQRAALATFDGAACTLGTSREALVLALLDGGRPPGVSEERLVEAIGDGIDRAEREGELSGAAATGLRLAVQAGGVLGIAGLLLGE